MRRVTGHDVHVGDHRGFVDAGDGVIVEVRLLNAAIGGGDLAHHGEAGAEDGGAFKLRADAIRVDDLAGVDG